MRAKTRRSVPAFLLVLVAASSCGDSETPTQIGAPCTEDFTIAITPGSVDVPVGETASVTVTLTPTPAGRPPGPVDLSVSFGTTTSGFTGTFDPASVSITTSAVTSVLTVANTGSPSGSAWVTATPANVVQTCARTESFSLNVPQPTADLWQEVPSNLIGTLFASSFPSQSVGYVGGTDGIATTTDGGFSWTAMANPTGVNGLFFVSPSTGFAVTTSGGVFKTTDGGSNWGSPTILTTGGAALKEVQFLDANNGYAGGTRDATGTPGLWSTTDGGQNWAEIPGPFNNAAQASVLCLHFTSDSTGVVGTETMAYYTSNGGAAWQSAASSRIAQMSFTDAMDGIAVTGMLGDLLQTTDGGQTWTPLASPDASRAFLDVAYLSPAVTLVGMGGEIYRSDDDGASWTVENEEIPASADLWTVSMFSLAEGFAAGESGLILLRAP